MTRLKRSLLLLPVAAAAAAGMSGCDWLAVIDAAQRCAHGEESACTNGVSTPELASVSLASGSKAAGRGFRLSFRGRLVERPTVYAESGGASAGQTLARGRFSGTLLKDSPLSERFERGRWVASTDFYYDPDTRALNGHAFVLVRFAQHRAGSVCLYVNVSKARRKNGGLRETGLVIPLGGTGLGARLTGSTRFVSREGRLKSRTRGKTGFRLRETRRAPSSCGTLTRIR